MASLVIAATCIGFSSGVHAQEVGSPDDAVSLTKQAIAAIKADGAEKAYAAIRDPNGPFLPKDLYVFCLDMAGVTVVHGRTPALIGRNMSEFKDSDGKLFFQDMIKVIQAGGAGWVDYKWSNPVTKKIESKTSYVERVDDNSFCGVGVYKK